MPDYYNTLGVSKDSSPDEIKRAYRRLASQHHPDKGGDTKKFQEIEEAYRTLGDPEKRQAYDNPAPQGFREFGGMPPGFEDLFASMMGGNNPFGDIFGRRQQGHRNRTLNIQTQINLEDAFTGKELMANLKLPSGRDQMIEVKIPAGIQDGTTLRLSGMGDDTFPNSPRGDIHLTVNVMPHSIFRRQGDDLVREIEISAIDAMLGKTLLVDTIDGRTLEIQINAGTQPGQILSASGYGMPNMRDPRFTGRMLLEIKINIPKYLTDEQKTALEKLFH